MREEKNAHTSPQKRADRFSPSIAANKKCAVRSRIIITKIINRYACIFNIERADDAHCASAAEFELGRVTAVIHYLYINFGTMENLPL